MNSILLVLRELHNHKMVHCDIKPDNLLVNNNDLNMVYLIDFGFTRRYSSEDKKMNSSVGTLDYMSRKVHEKYQPSYADDIESLFYVSLFLYKSIPWSSQFDPDIIKKYKHTHCFAILENYQIFFKDLLGLFILH